MINFLKKIFYALPFGMKAGDDMLLKQKASSTSDDLIIHQIITNDNIGENLLKGEVTQQVEELRYMDYKVSNESKKYKYIGDGKAIKIGLKRTDSNNHSFTQDNKLICDGVYDELKRVDSYGTEKYTISVIMPDIPRFKLEVYCTSIDVNIHEGEIDVKLHFSKYPDKYNITSKSFINELNKSLNDGYYARNCEFYKIQQLSFVTNKAINEDDLIKYNFYDLTLQNVEEQKHEYILNYKANWYSRDNLIDKFYSSTMETKYVNNDKKNDNATFIAWDRSEKCEMCGKEMNKYDADITKSTYGKAICIECLEKEIMSNNDE